MTIEEFEYNYLPAEDWPSYFEAMAYTDVDSLVSLDESDSRYMDEWAMYCEMLKEEE